MSGRLQWKLPVVHVGNHKIRADQEQLGLLRDSVRVRKCEGFLFQVFDDIARVTD